MDYFVNNHLKGRADKLKDCLKQNKSKKLNKFITMRRLFQRRGSSIITSKVIKNSD